MLALCELRHNVVVSPHDVGMLLSLFLCGRRSSAASMPPNAGFQDLPFLFDELITNVTRTSISTLRPPRIRHPPIIPGSSDPLKRCPFGTILDENDKSTFSIQVICFRKKKASKGAKQRC